MAFDISLFINSCLLIFAVLGLGSLAGYFCEKVGIINIAIDGQMIFGALIFSIFGMIFNQLFGNLRGVFILIPILLSAIFSLLLSWIYGLLTIKLKANHVVVGTAINLVVAGIATFMTSPLGVSISSGASQKLKVDYIPEWKISDGFFGETILIFAITAIIIVVCILLMNRTRFGLRFKAIGENPNAVDAQGINVNKYKWYGMMISGLFGAVAGSIFILGGAAMYPQSSFFEGNVAGLGFLALAIVVSGAWKIPFMMISAIFFAGLISAINILSNEPSLKEVFGEYVKYISKAIPFILSLIALIIFSRKGYGPKALGKHFDKELR